MKSSKKALALALAAAMVVTAVPATNANAATIGLSAKKATIYAGGSKTLTVKTPKSWKSVKVTASTSKKKVAKVKKISAKKVKVTAIKAGTAKVKVKVTYKKSTKKNAKKYTKTYTCKTTVKTPTIKLNQTKVTLNVGDTTPVKVTKKTPSSITVKYSSEDPAIASVAKGTITAVSAGTTNIVVKAKYGKKTITKKVEVTVTAAKDGLTPVLTNQLSATDYPNTVLVSDPAIVKVTYAKDGKPVAGQTLVISNNNDVVGTGPVSDYEFENVSATTNASGVATFVIKNRYAVKASASGEVASVNYRIQLADGTADTGTAAVTGTVNFASINVTDLENENNKNDATNKKDNLVPGTNYLEVHGYSANSNLPTYPTDAGLWYREYETNTTQGITYADYVASQQVSTAGTTEHAVTMRGGYPVITLPGTRNDAKTTKGSQQINYTSGEYKTYSSNKKIIALEKNPKELSYATLNFKDVSLSKYTCLEVYAYNTEDDAKNDKTANAFDIKEYSGEMTSASFGYQIPLSKSAKNGVWIVVKLTSKGQVQVGKNGGYTATTIDYVYKNPTSTLKTAQIYKGGKVTWKLVDTPYTAETAVISLGAVNFASIPDSGKDHGFDFDNYKYTVKLPVFPYTGNAIITKADKNGKIQAYYAVETENHWNQKASSYDNVNEIAEGRMAYQISADEVRETTGTLSQTDTTVTMNAEKAGRMTLEGVVTINGKELDEADLAHVYTSVQWNPVPKNSVTNSKNYVALLGQKIEVVAQLIDKNGNAVSESNQPIAFSAGTTPLTANASVTGENGKTATVVSLKSNTDSQGQAKVTLTAADITTIKNVTAKATDTKYDVVLKVVKDENVESADLYWADANLAFTDKTHSSTTVSTSSVDASVKTKGKADIQPTAGDSWFYGVYTLGTYYDLTKRTDADITITGIDVAMSKTPESVGTYENLGGGTAKATSTKAGNMAIVTKINSSTGTSNATVVKDGFKFAGKGAPSVDKKLELDVNWTTNGITASYVLPTGSRVTTGNPITVYVKVKDTLGNPVEGKTVTFGLDKNATFVNGQFADYKFNKLGKLVTVASGDPDYCTNATIDTTPTFGSAITDSNGIARIQLKADATVRSGDTTIVTAKVAGVDDQSFDQTFRWVANDPDNAVAINDKKNAESNQYVTKFDKDKKTVTLVFKDDVVTESVIKELFKVTIGDPNVSGAMKEYAVKSVVADGSVVTLTLADVPEKILVGDKVTVEIANKVAVEDSDRVGHTLTYVNGMVNAISAVEIDANNLVAPRPIY